MNEIASRVGLLAPIPEEHLISGAELSAAGNGVFFGSRNFEVFRELDALLQGGSCAVFIYSSWATDPLQGPAKATWTANYAGHVDARPDGSPPQGIPRPASTAKYPGDNKGHWAVYWKITDLRRIPRDEWLRISTLRGFRSKKRYLATFRPERPMLIEAP